MFYFKKIILCLWFFHFVYVSSADARLSLDSEGVSSLKSPAAFSKFIEFQFEHSWDHLQPHILGLSVQAIPTDRETLDIPDTVTDDEDLFFEEEFVNEFEKEFNKTADSKVFDPLSGYNRFMTQVNDKFYFYLLKPIANGYRFILPQGIRLSVARFFKNLLFPMHFVNNILQFKFKQAGVEFARFGLNTTIGIGGFWDPAEYWLDLNSYPEDFGQTLGYYGVGGGFHLVLPILGPSNFRDLIGLIGDMYLDPICYVGTCYAGHGEIALSLRSSKTINTTSLHIGEYESIKKDALDLYTFIRDAYEQKRKKEIKE